MKNCNQKPYRRLKIQPNNILEIKIDMNNWNKVLRIAQRRQMTYSWVVRYCVFRLIRENIVTLSGQGATVTPKIQEKYRSAEARAKCQVAATSKHRHRLCLYGTDEFFIRNTSAAIGCTMSHLVRFALECFLEIMAGDYWNDPWRKRVRSVYFLGVKMYGDVEIPNKTFEELRFLRFKKHEYW